MLINCTNCRTPLQLPPGDPSTVRCVICQAITQVAAASDYRSFAPPPPPAPVPVPLPLPNVHGRKRAVICGIAYKNTDFFLKGCINDAKCMRYLLTGRFHFPEDSILMLTEDEPDPYRIPTKANMRMAMYWLVQGCQPGDSLVFHFSGHGSQQWNPNGEEVDGFDETLVPLDFQTQGMIVDDEINATLVRPLPPGVRLHALMDCCHSGTALDLPYLCRMVSDTGHYVWEDHRPMTGTWKGTSGGEVISFSGCDDHQTSSDTSALSKVTNTGAMTFCFIQAIELGQATTYGSILNSMRHAIRTVGSNGGGAPAGPPNTNLMNMLVYGGSVSGHLLKQEVQLTANETFDVYTKPFFI
ncbi:hypothetical protein JRO89_XS01G0005100 [Xanthoceras sorbifolium]|uniref:Uncharacterized protein n=1 Tax=Xanthoceras sorbifolium TaxID=99658 RepID=A0ABQ8IJ16_9ROSI|nr:hypothetical protein JRO89_XS01G0005100 [Xanthoceras sorbifolium]